MRSPHRPPSTTSSTPASTTTTTTAVQGPLSTSPATGQRREVGLDIVRGLAVLGTFGTNVWLFTHPAGMFGSLVDPLAGIDSDAELFIYGLAAGLPNGKFLALLMMVFGMGLTIQYSAWNRRQASGGRGGWLRAYAPRALILLLDGTVNFVLVAEFDILMGYAFTGFIVAALIAGSPRTARIWMWCTGLIHAGGLLLLAGLVLTPAAPSPAASSPTGQTTPTGSAGPALPAGPAAAVHQDGSFLDLALFRLDHALLFRAEPVLTLAMGVCLFLVGARLFARGVFTEDGGPLRKRLMLMGACALPIDIVLGFTGFASGILLQRYLTAPFVALGLLGLIAHLARTRAAHTLAGRWAAAVGRMSLSVYVAQNLLAGALFYGWGLGLASRFPDHRIAMTLIAVVVVVAAMIAFAIAWQTTAARGAMRRGPLEAISHALSATRTVRSVRSDDCAARRRCTGSR